jgi:hypothetical protein
MYALFNFNRYKLYCIAGIVTLVGSLAGTLAWFVRYIASLSNNPTQTQVISPIDLAAVTATLGGLILVGAFYKGKDANNTEKVLANDLKLVGKLVLFSSACFIIGYFLIVYVSMINDTTLTIRDWFFVIMTDFAMIFAGCSISFALGDLVTIIKFI